MQRRYGSRRNWTITTTTLIDRQTALPDVPSLRPRRRAESCRSANYCMSCGIHRRAIGNHGSQTPT